ncbi:MAG: hypothetical protein RLZZ76_501 [Candidatus Parcubacteria bacterium]|jgi:hypothetical protein
MSEFISVNGKKYLTSGQLSGIFSYTPDYIGKLAREEKVLGIQIDRQWFIEPTSLEVYLQKIEIEKKIQKDTLRQKRKSERLAFERKNNLGTELVSTKYRGVQAASLALIVLSCGVLIGGLSFVTVSEQLTPTIVAQGAHEVFSFVGDQVRPSLPARVSSGLGSESLRGGAASTFLHDEGDVNTFVSEEKNEGMFTVLPQGVATPTAPVTPLTILAENTKQIQFSDEVRVVVDVHGEYYLEPVLKKGTDEETVLVADERGGVTSVE